MRTTITLNDALESRLRSYAIQRRIRFKEVINEALRLGLDLMETPSKSKIYKTKPKKVGLRKGLNFDNVSELIEQIEGVNYR